MMDMLTRPTSPPSSVHIFLTFHLLLLLLPLRFLLVISTQVCLKYGYMLPAVLAHLSAYIDLMATTLPTRDTNTPTTSSINGNHSGGDNEEDGLHLLELLSSSTQDSCVFLPDLLLILLLSHSMFSRVMSRDSTMRRAEVHGGMVMLIARVVSLAQTLRYTNAENENENDGAAEDNAHAMLSSEEASFMLSTLLSAYDGTISHKDRALLRTIHLLHQAGLAPPPASLCLPSKGPGSTAGEAGRDAGESGVSYSSKWIVRAMSMGDVYLMLSQYSHWRGGHPQPLHFESARAKREYR